MGFWQSDMMTSLPSGNTMQRTKRSASTALIALAVTMSPFTSAAYSDMNPSGNVTKTTKTTRAKDQGNISPGRSQGSAPQYILGLRDFSIPFSTNELDAMSSEVRLYVLHPKMSDWVLHSSVALKREDENSEANKFRFLAEEDGVYHFATRTADNLGRENTATPIKAEISVLVDTTEPDLSLKVDSGIDGEILISFDIKDDSELQEQEIRYATDTHRAWVSVDPKVDSEAGAISIRPAEQSRWTYASVEFTATDAAGNSARVVQQVRRPRIAAEPMKAASVVAELNDASVAETPSSNMVADSAQTQNDSAVLTGEFSEVTNSTEADLAGFRNPTVTSDGSEEALTRTSQDSKSGANDEPSSEVEVHRDFVVPPTQSSIDLNSSVDAIALPPSDSVSTNKISGNHEMVRIAQLGNQQRRPASLFEKLFGITPPLNPLVTSDQTSTMKASDNLIQPVYPSITAQLVGNPQELLPPPASPSQISEGFGLNGPVQNVAPDTGSQSNKSTSPSGGVNRTEVLPETLPQGIGQGSTSSTAPSSIADRKAETPAQAMRPINEMSQVVPLLEKQEKAVDTQIEVKVPETQQTLPLYEAQRSDLDARSSQDAAYQALLSKVPVRFSKGKRFSLDYELEAVGLQGAESIELYGTTDFGKSWQLWGSDPDRQSPFDIETQDVGAFGYRICVVGRNGLASPRPLSGEVPDIFVVVDTEKPEVKITGAQYGQGSRVGSLVISYECSDENLPQRPITLAFSDSIEGPWTTIVGGLRNEGQYIWSADPNLPRQLYLRIDVVDEAGNRGVYLLDQPIDTQGLAPRAKIRGFQPLSNAGGNPSQPETTASRSQIQF